MKKIDTIFEPIAFHDFVASLPLDGEECDWLVATLKRFDGAFPSLEQIWQLMDEAWAALGCDEDRLDERVTAFYTHPVWLLNGLFIEQHDQSRANRREFATWVASANPKRVADFGGGYGTLARMIGEACPIAQVEVIEPHPHRAAMARATATANVRYREKLTGEYDILIATDVFEHVPDPLALVESTARYLRPGGQYLIANCFWPVIRCHLPQTFHFRYSWDWALTVMGLIPGEMVCYGRAFVRRGELILDKSRVVERRSRWLFPWIDPMPRRVRQSIIRLICGYRV